MSISEKAKQKPNVPAWAGCYPFEPGRKRPKVLKREEAMPRLYGRAPHKVPTCVFASTDRLTSSEFCVPPGEYFEPADIHGGDEVYYVSRGRATVHGPETGRTYAVPKGGAVYIPRGTWHQTYNFCGEKLEIITFFAPKMWCDDMGTEVDYTGECRLYKGKSPDEVSGLPIGPHGKDAGLATPMNGRLGEYPVSARDARRQKLLLPIPPESTLDLIHGNESRVLVSFFVSNEVINAGIMTIPAFRESGPEAHRGDEVCCVLEGAVSVVVTGDKADTRSISVDRFEVRHGERFLIPEGTAHRYYNDGEKVTKLLFCIAPEL